MTNGRARRHRSPATANSCRLAYVLRHDPQSIGVELDAAGWVDVDTLLRALAAGGLQLTRVELTTLVASSDKQRFALDETGRRIRANQGHSIPVDLGLAPIAPPEDLFHGTVEAALAGIRQHGLQRRGRHHVHLSPDAATARVVGARRGHPAVLAVAARRMAADGWRFYRSTNGVWLVDEVPPAYLSVLEGLSLGDRGGGPSLAPRS